MPTKPVLITSRDPKGTQFLNLCGAAYDKAKLDEAEAQRLNERGGELQAAITKAIRVLSSEGKVFDLSWNIEAMIRAGYHTAIGMSDVQYRALWPTSVIQPAEYVGRFDQVLLVDRAIEPGRLIELGKIVEYVKFADCTDLVDAPKNEDGKLLVRYVAFIQDGKKNLGRSVEEVRRTFAEGEVGLVTLEGFHLPVQHEKALRHHGVDLSGSRHGDFTAPCVGWFGSGRPGLFVDVVRDRLPRYGSASRGSQVIAVS